jgi:hypothetical protein
MALQDGVIVQDTVCSSKQEFTTLLRRWYECTSEDVIGPSASQGRTPWLWLQVGDVECHLNADTKRLGVQRYLELVERHSPGMAWHIRLNQNGININKVCFGPGIERIRGFYLYVRPPLPAAMELL